MRCKRGGENGTVERVEEGEWIEMVDMGMKPEEERKVLTPKKKERKRKSKNDTSLKTPAPYDLRPRTRL